MTKAASKSLIKLYEKWDKAENAAEYRTMLLVEEPLVETEQDGTPAGK